MSATGHVLEVRHDGAGGADPTRGTGFVGFTDRVAALDGSIAVTRPARVLATPRG